MNTQHYTIIANAIQYLAEHRELQPNLADLSTHLGLSEFHLQRIFSEWVGVSPKQFLQYLTKEYAKQKLKQATVFETAHACGFGSASRLHDLMIQCEGMTPGEYKQQGQGLTIQYGVSDSPFGQCFIAVTERGICKLAFYDSDDMQLFLQQELIAEWSNAKLVKEDDKIATLATTIFAPGQQTLKLLLKGSPFQLKVWEALLSIPEGELVAYQDIATAINAPKAVRAVASAIARNHIAYLIPCHRVVRQNGDFGQYRWNEFRKQVMIAREAFIANKS